MIEFERTFDNSAEGYDRIRPDYPQELYRDIFSRKQITAESDVLEIGLGTGKASQPFLETHCRFTGIEPGENLAALANMKYKNYSRFSLRTQTLQEFECPAESFDLIYAATAFHWIEEEYGYRRVFDLLKKGGIFARFAYHASPDRKRVALTDEIGELYGKFFSAPRKAKEFGDAEAKTLADIALKYGFASTEHKLYRMKKDFTADEYMTLLCTYPDHMALERDRRELLFGGIHCAINRHGGIITVNYIYDLELAAKPR